MFGLQTLRSDPPDARMIEILNRDPVPLGMIVDQQGRQIALDSFRGKTLILNLWAPWCVPCLKEMPSLDRLAASLPEDKFAVVAGGRPSITHYETVEAFRAASLLDVRLETGRTHQIRVHLSAVRHPCVGDLVYGADPVLARRLGLTRQWLHAARLTVAHPATGTLITFEAPVPADLRRALEVLAEE